MDIVRPIFRKYFTQNADMVVRYLDEGYSPAKSILIDRDDGIELEIECYSNGYKVMYFPFVKDDLRQAATLEINKKKGEGTIKDKTQKIMEWMGMKTRGGSKKRINKRITLRKVKQNIRKSFKYKN
jgi:hypothetical protein